MATGFCVQPYVVTVSGVTTHVPPQVVESRGGVPIHISWTGAQAGTSNPITGYKVILNTVNESMQANETAIHQIVSTTNTYGSVDFEITDEKRARGLLFKFTIKTLGTVPGYDSIIGASSVTMRRNSLPPKPACTKSGSAVVYKSQPRILLTVGADSDPQTRTLSSADYTYSSATPIPAGEKKIIAVPKTAIAANETLDVTIHAIDSLGAWDNTDSAEDEPNVSIQYVPPNYTDTMATGATRIKAAHMTELRTMIDNVRDYYGLAAYSWAEAITTETSMAGWGGHVAEMRTAIEEIAAVVNAWDTTSATNRIVLPTWITIVGKQPSAAVMQQIRDVIPTL